MVSCHVMSCHVMSFQISVDREHEHCFGRQQEALPDERRNHRHVRPDESNLRTRRLGTGQSFIQLFIDLFIHSLHSFFS